MKIVNFAKLTEGLEPPDLVEVQKRSYADFLQHDVPKPKRQNAGLQAAFLETFPIESPDKTYRLDYVHYSLGKPKYSVEECHQRGMTYAAPLKVTIQLVLWDLDQRTGARTIKNVKEQEVYFGEIPLMTAHGTFMVNGTERVIVSQLHRSPGICFEESVHPNGKVLHSFRVIPDRGSWLEVGFDQSDLLYFSRNAFGPLYYWRVMANGFVIRNKAGRGSYDATPDPEAVVLNAGLPLQFLNDSSGRCPLTRKALLEQAACLPWLN